jgi:hypothetical protein
MTKAPISLQDLRRSLYVGLIADATVESGPQDVQFCFRHRALQSEHETIVEKRRMVDTIAVSDQSVGYAAQIEQAIPVSIVARQAGDFEAEHDSHMTQSDFCGHACESGTLHRSRTGETQISVDDDHLFLGPAQRPGFLDQSLLASGGLAVVLDLRRTRLANINESRTLGMTWFYFAEIIHDPSPRYGVGLRSR